MDRREIEPALDRRDYPRLKAAFRVRYGVCGGQGREVPGFTNDVSVGGVRFATPDTTARLGDHLAVEITVPGYDEPLYFIGQVVRLDKTELGTEVACRFDWLGKSEAYREKLEAMLRAHAE